MCRGWRARPSGGRPQSVVDLRAGPAEWSGQRPGYLGVELPPLAGLTAAPVTAPGPATCEQGSTPGSLRRTRRAISSGRLYWENKFGCFDVKGVSVRLP